MQQLLADPAELPPGLTARQHRVAAARRHDMLTSAIDYINTPSSQFDLEWGRWSDGSRGSEPATESSQRRVNAETRKTVVKNVYPRLLYAFSDVICYVTINGRHDNAPPFVT